MCSKIKLSPKIRLGLTSPCTLMASRSGHPASPAARPRSVDSASSAPSADELKKHNTYIQSKVQREDSKINSGAWESSFAHIFDEIWSGRFDYISAQIHVGDRNQQLHKDTSFICFSQDYIFILPAISETSWGILHIAALFMFITVCEWGGAEYKSSFLFRAFISQTHFNMSVSCILCMLCDFR